MKKQVSKILNRLSQIVDELDGIKSDIEDLYDEWDERVSEDKLTTLNEADNYVDLAMDELRVAMNHLKSIT